MFVLLEEMFFFFEIHIYTSIKKKVKEKNKL